MFHRRSGQLFTADMIASILIFVLIVNLSLMTWNLAERNSVMFNEERALRDRAARMADLLVRTPGYPENWTADTVEIVGMTDPDHVVATEKVEAFDALTYTEQQDLLRTRQSEFLLRITDGSREGGTTLGEQPVALIVEQSASPSNRRIHTVLNESGLTWDLYWPSSSTQGLSSLTARNVYTYTTNGDIMFDDMLENASDSAYETIIGENVNLDTGDIQKEALLKGFVENGSSYIHTEEKPELLTQLFGFDDVSVGSGNGTVLQTAPLLNGSLERGDYVQFQDEQGAFTNVTTRFVNDTAQPYGCLACKWTVGNGSVYYAADAVAEDGDTLTFSRAAESFGPEVFEDIGRHVSDGAETVAVTERRVLVNESGGREAGELELVFWR